jgi:hypothetical protein
MIAAWWLWNIVRNPCQNVLPVSGMLFWLSLSHLAFPARDAGQKIYVMLPAANVLLKPINIQYL